MSESANPTKRPAKKSAAKKAASTKAAPSAKKARAQRAQVAPPAATEPFLPPVAEAAEAAAVSADAPAVPSIEQPSAAAPEPQEAAASAVVPNAVQRIQDALMTPPDERGKKPIVQEGVAIIAERKILSSDEPRTLLDRLAPVSKRLEASIWYDRPVFEWCLDPTAFRHRFTRWYPEKHVLVDVFESITPRVRSEVEDKIAKIIAENERREARGHEPIGYLPMVRGVTTPDEDFDRAIRGEQVGVAEAAAV